jgi:competence protein ComEA
VISRRQILTLALAAAFVPTQASPATHNAQALPLPESRVDINHATLDDLLKVPGMAPSWAGRIIRFRPYRSKNDLVERGVMTSEAYARIKDYVIAHRTVQ